MVLFVLFFPLLASVTVMIFSSNWFNVNSVIFWVFIGILVHISTLYLSEAEGLPPRLGVLSEKYLEIRISRLAQNAHPSLV